MCLHELSERHEIEVDCDGRFPVEDFDGYFRRGDRAAYFIRVKDKLAGFVLVKQSEALDGGKLYSISQFFLLHMYRGLGIGEEIARTVFDLSPGTWQVPLNEENPAACQFFKKVVWRYTAKKFRETSVAGWDGQVIEFSSPGAGSAEAIIKAGQEATVPIRHARNVEI
jgi:predicted acetyltransferase